MGLIELLLALIVVGVLLYLVETVIPMDGAIKTVIRVVVVVVVVLWVIRALFGDIAIPRFH